MIVRTSFEIAMALIDDPFHGSRLDMRRGRGRCSSASQTIAVFPRPVISSLIRSNHVAIPSTVTRLSQTCPRYTTYTRSLPHRFRSQRLLRKPGFIRSVTFKEANVTKPVSGNTLAADLIETRLGKEIIFASFESSSVSLTRSPDNLLQFSNNELCWVLYEQVTRWTIETSSIR